MGVKEKIGLSVATGSSLLETLHFTLISGHFMLSKTTHLLYFYLSHNC
jgi:hypothetical protein